MSANEYERGRELGRAWADAYPHDRFELKLLANGEGTPEDSREEVARIVGEGAVDNVESELWGGFRAGVAGRLTDDGIIESSTRLIEKDGVEFEPPPGHRSRIIEGMGDNGAETWIALSSGVDGSIHVVDRRELRGGAEVIHVGRQVFGHVIGSGFPMRDVTGYPFPEAEVDSDG